LSKRKRPRAAPAQKRTDSTGFIWLASPDAYSVLLGNGYTSLVNCPEVQTAVNRVADLISSMTIHLMSNTKDGDIRIKNELSRKIDINPNRWATRKAWMYSIVRNIMLDGDGNAVHIPHIGADGLLEDIEPLDMAQTVIQNDPTGYGYWILYKGQRFQPDEVLHFIDNPDPQKPWRGTGYKVLLRDIAQTLKQARGWAQKTKRTIPVRFREWSALDRSGRHA